MQKKIFITGGSGFIGTYLIDELAKKGYDILNVDVNAPLEADQKKYWKKISILSREKLIEAMVGFNPVYVIHLAARTDTDPDNKLEDYRVNYDGSASVLNAIKATASIERAIITSTQFVNQYEGYPKHDEDFAPHTVYGESKVLMEKMTRTAGLNCCWTITRPTNIWGPRHPRYPNEFWHVLKSGRYFHPGKKPVIRSYGYVGNVVAQMISILQAKREDVDKQVFYVGDDPTDIHDWVNGFSLALTGRKVRVVPRLFVRSLAYAGDFLRLFKIKFPITSSRYRSMTHSNSAPMEKTFKVLGKPRFTLGEGIAETVTWLKEQGKFWNRV